MLRKILFAHDGSSAADRALLYVEHLGREEEGEVVVVHAYEVPNRYATTDVYDELRETIEKAAWAVVDDSVNELQSTEVLARGVVREGPAARVILEVAEQENASL
ncbi:MAG: universal stress protein, partial [Anaerolineae bacterium]|nr:universal stress protein [Anaerolineae bacterium]